MGENVKSVPVPSFQTAKYSSNKNTVTIIKVYKDPRKVSESFYPTSNNEVMAQENSSIEKVQVKMTIYMCTFCQVFSLSKSDMVSHIISLHKTSLPCGKKAEDFVSQLQSLQKENEKKRLNKGGRPRKKESSTVIEEKAILPEPVLGPDGLYWCQKCHRHFRKPRQFSSHVCLEMAVENLSCESTTDSDSTSDFQTYMDIEPTPWRRRPKHNNEPHTKKSLNVIHSPNDEKLCESDLLKPKDDTYKMKVYWRDDPNYVHLFENNAERYAFEEHLKSIDYSCIDNLFVKAQSKSKRLKKRYSSNNTLYSCIICQKEFHSLSHIGMHCLTHTDLKPFTCPKCQYRTNTKGSLYTHMRNHTGKLFYCSKCSFKTIKRSHLLEHEQTHSSIMQLCSLCGNAYKTIKSLIAHVQRYHNNPAGKKYVKFLSGKSSKVSSIKCNICQMKFKTQTSFSIHVHTTVPTPATIKDSHETIKNTSLDYSVESIQNISASMNCSNENIQSSSTAVNHSPNIIQNTSSGVVNVSQEPLTSILDSNLEYANEMQILKYPLDEMALNDFLQQKTSEIYQNMFQHCTNPHIQTESESQPNAFTAESSMKLSPLGVDNQFQTSNTILEECDKTFDILKECLKDSGFAEQVMAETCGQSFKLVNNSESFGLHKIQIPYHNESIISPGMAVSGNLAKSVSHIDSELNGETEYADFISTEPKSVETKLFEKCHQTAAYVCCVCQAIYVCPLTLRIHLQNHVNTNNSLIEQHNEDMVQEADAATIDSVCQMLEDSDNERELEKLYNSSLDMMYYLPEVSVLLENDPKFIDSVLNEFSSFPISDESEYVSEM